MQQPSASSTPSCRRGGDGMARLKLVTVGGQPAARETAVSGPPLLYKTLKVRRPKRRRGQRNFGVRRNSTHDCEHIHTVSGTVPVLLKSTIYFLTAPLAISRGGRSEALGRSLCVIRVGIHQW